MTKIVFLISQPRSGSTLLQRILNNHSEVSSLSEPWIALPMFYGDLFDNIHIAKSAKYDGNLCEAAIKETLSHIPDTKHKIKTRLAELYTGIIKDITSNKEETIFLDKTPRYYYILDELIKYFPDAKFIILHRNPFSVLNSILSTWVHKSYLYLSYYKDDLILAPLILNKSREYKNKNIHHIKYEDLINEPNTEVKKICEFIEIQYSEELLKLKKENKWKLGDPVNAFKKTKIEKNISQKWENLPSAQHWKIFRDYLRLLKKMNLEKYDYSLDFLEETINKQKPSMVRRLFSLPLAIFLSNFAVLYINIKKPTKRKLGKLKRRILKKIK